MKISTKLQFKKNIFNKKKRKIGRNISNFSSNDRFKFVTNSFKECIFIVDPNYLNYKMSLVILFSYFIEKNKLKLKKKLSMYIVLSMNGNYVIILIKIEQKFINDENCF